MDEKKEKTMNGAKALCGGADVVSNRGNFCDVVDIASTRVREQKMVMERNIRRQSVGFRLLPVDRLLV